MRIMAVEAALGADFSAVRVHVGPQAERIGALAVAMGTGSLLRSRPFPAGHSARAAVAWP